MDILSKNTTSILFLNNRPFKDNSLTTNQSLKKWIICGGIIMQIKI